ncbi:MAG: hypothetical protein V4733_02020 [Verrucomicrobiota bacterium]
MKLQTFLPLIAASIGFAVAWMVKPKAPPMVLPPQQVAEGVAPAIPSNRPDRESSESTSPKVEEVKAGDFPLAGAAEAGPKTAEEAKMRRLSEALGLSLDQQAKIVAALQAARQSESGETSALADLATRGRQVEEALKAILTPEQFAKFAGLRARQNENRIEQRAHKELDPVLERIDLSPGQREEVAARLRQYQREELQEVPAAAMLLLGASMLPTDPRDPGIDGILAMVAMEEGGVDPSSTPTEVFEQMNLRQKEALERRLECFEGILTPGQMAQYHAYLAEQEKMFEEMRRRAAEARARKRSERIERDAAEAERDPVAGDE